MKKEILRQCPFWGQLTEEQKTHVEQGSSVKRYQDKEIIYSPARECLGIFLILEGVVRVYLADEQGNTATVFRMRKGDFCVLSMSCQLAEITFDVEMKSEGESQLFLIPTATFSRITKENIYVENFMYKIMVDKFSDMMSAVQRLMFYTLEQRVISFLLDESAVTGKDTLTLTQEQIAEGIGSAREAVSRVLSKLQKKNMISTSRGRIMLLKHKELCSLL